MNMINVQRRKIYENACEAMYDIITGDGEITTEVITAIKSPDDLRAAFSHGFTMMMVPEFMEQIEGYNEREEDFIICVYEDNGKRSPYGKLFAVINGKDVSF